MSSNGIFDLDGRFERIGGLSGSGQIKLGNASTPLGLAVDQLGLTTTFSGVISGTGAGARLLKEGTGTLILSGNNTHEGGTDINGGTLQISSFNAVGQTGVGISFDGGQLRTTASFGLNRLITLNAGGGTFIVDPFNTLDIQNVITGSGSLTKIGDGTLTLHANNDYSGGTNINGGTLKLGGSASLFSRISDSSALFVNGIGTFDLDGFF